MRQVGLRLKNGLRASDVLARYGGDEFVVAICVDPEAVHHESALRERLFELTRGQYLLDHGALDYPGPSIGIAVCHPGSTDMAGLLKRADQAMYAQKLQRRQQLRSRPEP
ncbi:MAG: GGDEF domain-containing protein [Thiomonas sp.]